MNPDQLCHYCHRPSIAQIIESFDEPPEALCFQCLGDVYPDYFQKHQARRKEHLLKHLVAVHSYDTTKLILEFKDTSVAYEKVLKMLEDSAPNLNNKVLVPRPGESPYIIFQIINPLTGLAIPRKTYGYKSQVNFSSQMEKIFHDFENSQFQKLREKKNGIKEVYKKISDTLGIEKYSYRDWRGVLELIPYTILWPFYPLMHYFLGGSSLSVLLAPWFLIKELSQQLIAKQAYKIKNLHQLYLKKIGDNTVEVYLEPRNAHNERFTDYSFQFSDGTVLYRNIAFRWKGSDNYEPHYYIKLDSTFKKELDLCLEMESAAFYRSLEFETGLTAEDHLTLLKHHNFID